MKSASSTASWLAAGGQERGLVGEVREIGADHPGRRRRDPAEVDVGRERHAARVHLEDRLAPGAVGRLDGDPAVEAAGAQQRLVEDVGPVGRADDDHAGRRVEAVHLGQDLVQRLLALVVAAAEAGDAGRARAADRVELVDEHDRRGGLLRLREQVAHARRADADDRLDELGRRHREERHVGLARDRPREQRLAGAGRAREQHAVRDPAAEPRYFSGWRRKSTTSVSSAFASSMPATSANVTRSPDGWYRRARERPNEPSTFCTLPARRISQNSRKRKRSVGPKPSSRFCHHGAPVSSGSAFTTTPFCWSRRDSALLSANAGISVRKSVVGFEPRVRLSAA